MSFGIFLSVVISAVAVWMDLKYASVDNGWILFSFIMGLVIQVMEKGPKGGIIFLTGAAVPVILLGILFVLRMLGAGDIKLLCALGGIMVWDPGQLWNVLFILCLQVRSSLWQFFFLQAVSASESSIYVSI